MAQNHFNILSITGEQDRKRITNQFNLKENALKEALETISKLKQELLEQSKRTRSSSNAKSQKNDLQTRQAQLIKSQVIQIKQLKD